LKQQDTRKYFLVALYRIPAIEGHVISITYLFNDSSGQFLL